MIPLELHYVATCSYFPIINDIMRIPGPSLFPNVRYINFVHLLGMVGYHNKKSPVGANEVKYTHLGPR